MYLKVIDKLKNRVGNSSYYIYGGLDMSKINASCVDEELNQAVVLYEGTEINENVVEITKEEFDTFSENVSNKNEKARQSLEEKVGLMQKALDELLLGGM